MSSIIENFTSLTDQDTDLLTPVEYRTIVEMIRGILARPEFKRLDAISKLFFTHRDSKDPLYKTSGVNFYEKVIENIHSIYTTMLESPLDYATFKTDILPTFGFVELFRRIVLNKYLYEQVKQPDGSVSAGTYAVNLTPEWQVGEAYPNPVSITFASTLANETEFFQLGWKANTAPFATIFNAEQLVYLYNKLPLVFSTTDDANCIIDDTIPVTLPIASNDLTIHVRYTRTPTSSTNLFKLKNAEDVLSVDIDVNRIVSVSLNNVVLITGQFASTDGKAVVILDRQGYLSLQLTNGITQLRDRVPFVFVNDSPLTQLTIGAPYKDHFNTGFGLRSLSISQGSEQLIPPEDIIVPLGYALLVDANGAYISDPDGTPLMDIDIDPGADKRGGFVYLVDRDGSFLINDQGQFYIVEADSHYVIVDTDGAHLLDEDGALIIEPLNS